MWRATLVWALVATGLRFALGLWLAMTPTWDGLLYERAARGILDGLGYSCMMFGPTADPYVATAYYPVGYPAYLAFFYGLFGVHHWVIALAGSIAGGVGVGLAHRLALRVTSPFRAHLAAAIATLFPGALLWSSTPMTETVWGTCLLAAIWALDEAPTTRRLVVAGAALAAAVYVRPNAILLAAALPLLGAGDLRARLRRLAITLGVTLALVAPWCLRNCTAIDGCAFVSANAGSNLAIGAVPRGDGTYLRLLPTEGCPRSILGEVARDRCWRRVAVDLIRRDPWGWAKRAVPKLSHTLDYERFPIWYLEEAAPGRLSRARAEWWRESVLSPTWRLLWWTSLAGLVFAWSRRGRETVQQIVVSVVLVMATHAVFFGGDRYHLPFIPMLAVLATRLFYGVESLSWVARWGSSDGRNILLRFPQSTESTTVAEKSPSPNRLRTVHPRRDTAARSLLREVSSHALSSRDA